jgi:hypothetical protein
VTSHAREWGRYRKFVARAHATNPVEPFIDRAGYLSYIDKAEEQFHNELADRQRSAWKKYL